MHPAFLLPLVAAASGCALALGSLAQVRRTIADWAFAAGMIVLGAECVLAALSASTDESDRIYRYQVVRLTIVSLLPVAWLIFSLSYSRGNAREFLLRSRYFLVAAFLVPVALAIGFNGEFIVGLQKTRPHGHWVLGLGWPGIVLFVFLLVGSVLVLMNLERTFRASVGTMRWRIKFMVLGVGLLFVARVYTSSQAILFRRADLTVESLNSGALLLATVLMARAFLRAGDLTLNVYPSQSLLQSSLTIVVAGMYLLLIGLFAKMVAYLGGDAGFAAKAFILLVALVLLVVLLQSDRVRLRFGRFVSRHFQRPLFDYRTVWRRFTEGTGSRVEAGDLSRVVVRLTADIFQALSVGIWLIDDKKEALTMAASTFLSEVKSDELRPSKGETAELIAHLQEHPEPIDIEGPAKTWAAALRRMHPSQFAAAGHRVCLPMVARGELLGVVVIGDRVGGASFSSQDFDMLKCIGDHATASLLNVHLSRQLLQAKEFEAFQTMAAFFVHDLKNAASTLNLMLQNLPEHFEDPAFREDALRGVSKSVAHINDLVGRLGVLRHELKIQPVDSDLNEVIANAIAALESAADLAVVKKFTPLSRLVLDRDQVAKVVTNLVLNAKEAGSGKGEIRIATRQMPGCAVFEVADDGCGMSPQFVARSLFRPFQTTKKKGLGIGMFQSKMIIEAHGGRIAVVSEPGRGTTFQVFLPLPKAVK